MRLKIKYSITIVALATLLTISSCDREPIPPPMPRIEQISIAELKDFYKGSTVVIDSSLFIQGIITLTPEKNNIPDFIGYIQDETGGLTLTIDGNNTLAEGSEIKIFCNGIELSSYNGLLQFGNIDLATQSELVSLVADPLVPANATIQEILAGDHIGELVSLSGVEFSAKGTFSGSKTLTDCSNSVAVYTRSSATFAGDALPEGNGTFVGVVSVFNDPQILLRDPSDLDMTGTRCAPFFEGIFQETFETLSDYDLISDLPGWESPMQAGTRDWIARTFSGNAYAQASAYNSGLASMITWMVTPAIDLSSATAPVLTFESRTGYHNGATLEVLISTDYNGDGTPWDATWTDLNPTLATGPANTYGDWTPSGSIDLSSYTNSIYLAFKYTGSDPANTTTWIIDNVTIEESSR